jgi:bifunctional oligoribonuclease and PAP phosphatase NrnA
MASPRQSVSDILLREDDFLVAAHANPDGDAVGSTAALGWLLRVLGKRFTLYNPTPMPPLFDWLPLPAQWTTTLPETLPAWAVILDCGDAHRVGPDLLPRLVRERTLNLDHHLGNPGFGAVNWVDTHMSAVGEMAALLAQDLGISLSGGLGEAVYLAMVTDTGNFSFGNTHPGALTLAAEILRQGLDPVAFNAKLLNNWSPNRLKLWSLVLGDTRYHHAGQVGVIHIPRSLLAATQATVHDTENLVNMVRRVKSVQVAISLREEEDGQVKFSLRSTGDVNVQAMAALLGGGGHKNASGGTVRGPLDAAEATIIEAVGQVMRLS